VLTRRLPLAVVLAALFVFLVLEVAVRQAMLLLVGVGIILGCAGSFVSLRRFDEARV